MQNFTSNDLLLFLFGESEPNITQQIEQALITDTRLQNQLQTLQQELDDISSIEMSPSPNVMENIMNALKENDSVKSDSY